MYHTRNGKSNREKKQIRNHNLEEEMIEEHLNQELVITQGGLYSPLPIPAYKLLIAAGEHVAKDVLLCLVSHMGKGNRKVFPSVKLIMREAGRGRASVIAAIRTLEEFGFVKKFQYWEPGKRRRSIYYLQEACWNNDRMSREAIAFAPIVGRCKCGEAVRLGEIGVGMSAYHHYGCGDVVELFSTKSNSSTKQSDIGTSEYPRTGISV
jgi:hypothetical protein